MKRLFSALLIVGLVGLATFSAKPAHASKEGLKIGILNCVALEGSGYNLIVTSSVNIKCKFTDIEGKSEYYKGETGIGLGVNLNFKAKERIAFSVLAASTEYKAGKYGLAGKYVGAKASASVGVGGGAAVLVGGGKKSIALQPLALEVNTGLGAAAGLGYLYIEPLRKKKK